MVLDQFVKETVVCVITAINGAKSAGMEAIRPKDGIEFDLGINIVSGKIEVVGQSSKDFLSPSRIKFVIPIVKE
jgi:hypothetical protein